MLKKTTTKHSGQKKHGLEISKELYKTTGIYGNGKKTLKSGLEGEIPKNEPPKNANKLAQQFPPLTLKAAFEAENYSDISNGDDVNNIMEDTTLYRRTNESFSLKGQHFL